MFKTIIFDTETKDMKESILIETAWVGLGSPEPLTATNPFVYRYKPSKSITFGALATHHTMDKKLVD